MENIKRKLEINASVSKVYEHLVAQEGLSGWWTPDTNAKSEVNNVLRFGFGSSYFKEMKVVELILKKKVTWKCVTRTEEWVGTTVQIDLVQGESNTILLFSHNDWEAQTTMFSQCSFDWAMFLRSLRKLCETGKGYPYPNPDQ